VAGPCSASCHSIRPRQHSQRFTMVEAVRGLQAVAVDGTVHGLRRAMRRRCNLHHVDYLARLSRIPSAALSSRSLLRRFGHVWAGPFMPFLEAHHRCGAALWRASVKYFSSIRIIQSGRFQASAGNAPASWVTAEAAASMVEAAGVSHGHARCCRKGAPRCARRALATGAIACNGR